MRDENYGWVKGAAQRWLLVANQINDDESLIETQNLVLSSNLYLAASYLYYIKDTSLFSDHAFDTLCRHLVVNYHLLSPSGVMHVSHLFSPSELQAGSGYVAATRVSDIMINLCSYLEGMINEQSVSKGTGHSSADISPPAKPGRDRVRDPGDDDRSSDRTPRVAVVKGCEEVIEPKRTGRAKRTKVAAA